MADITISKARTIIRKALDDAIQAALTDAKTPEAALKEAQATAKRLLRVYQ